jgi:hypothetical protein
MRRNAELAYTKALSSPKKVPTSASYAAAFSEALSVFSTALERGPDLRALVAYGSDHHPLHA